MADPTYRASMLPIGTYANPDGTESLGWAVPGMIEEPLNALTRLFGSGNFAQGPDYPGNADDMRTLLFSMYGGNALNPARMVEGATARAAEAAPYALYRGAPNAEGLIKGDRPMVMSSSPQVAETYARDGAIAPAQAYFQNPMIVDAQGRAWNDIPFGNTWTDSNHLAYTARDAGHDGLIIKNVTDQAGFSDLPPADTVFALKRGTVTSPLTGETLFSDTGRPSIFGAALAGVEKNGNEWISKSPYGRIDARFDPDNNAVRIQSSAVTPGHQGEGHGMELYRTLIDDAHSNGYPVISDASVSPSAQRVYESLDRQGYDLNVNPKASLLVGHRVPGTAGTGGQGGVFSLPPPNYSGPALFSDTGLPSIWGSALYQDQEPRNALLDY